MKIHSHSPVWPIILALAAALLLSALVLVEGAGSTASFAPVAQDAPDSPDSACSGGPTIDGIKLDECHKRTFVVGGVNKSVTVWYTKKTNTATRTLNNGTTVTLSHWISTDAQAQQVAAWGQEAWQRYFAIYNRGPYDKGCNNNINVQMEDGVGWSGIAYWASPGDCWIGIDSPMVRGGGGQWVVYHEFQHYEQYAFDDGCYAYLKAHYNSGAADGDAEFVEGYADLAADAVDAALDLTGYAGITYPPETSMYKLDYGNLYSKYFMEQTGSTWLPADPWHHMDAVRSHYSACDNADTLYVLDTLIPSLKPGRSEESLFMDFFAANWAKDWANPATQPALVYTDDDASPYAAIPLAQDVTIASGVKSWSGQMTPDRWAGKYYQVKPQSGCNFVTASVDGAAGASLGINLMAAKTSAPAKVSRTSGIGEDLSRTFPAYGVNDRIVASINAFNTKYSYDVSFTCVSPTIDILEPKQANPAQVGDPASPIAFLARFKISSGGSPVLGVIESQITAQAEGAAVTLVPGSLQQVGMEYWATMIPPVEPAGTQKVDLKICLAGGACDTETDALLYEVPGKTDFALVFDASGSMSITDTAGEGSRLENAKKAGTLLADLLRTGDRIAVTDFSAFNNPPGCGLPSGSGNCLLDIRTRLARTDVTVPATINAAKNAINLISARDWTPIGAALVDGKNKLQAAPYSLNPKHVILLSDGEENVNPLYATVRNELIASGVIIDTIGLSGDAPEPLLAQIASDTGGTYRFVPTSSGGLSPENAASLDSQRSFLLGQGATPEMVDAMQAALLPGPLALDDVYDYLETKSQQASRLFWTNNNAVATNEWRTASTVVDESVNILRLVASSKQEDYDNPCGSSRFVEVLRPGAGARDWIPISPRGPTTPLNWDIRNSIYDDVVMIPNPEPGVWQIRSKWVYNLCAPTENPEVLVFDVMMTGSAETNLSVQGRFLDPIVNNQGVAGDVVPIVATVMDRNGTRPGSLVLAAIARPNGGDLLLLVDDGQHHDGGAGDGIYGNEYPLTIVGGTYNVTIGAWIYDAGINQWLTRNWMGAFWINGPEADDLDSDGMPDRWERRCKLNTNADDTALDNDLDGLTNWQEYLLGTLPCSADTDKGGEIDGSEVLANRNPRWTPDDLVRPVAHFNVSALNQRIRVEWTHPVSYTTMLGWFVPLPSGLTNPVDMGSTGVFTATGAVNGQEYLVALMGVNGSAFGGYTDISSVIPKADPDAPNGAILINGGAKYTGSRNVTLSLSSDDVPLPGLAESANAHAGGPLALQYNEVSGSAEMRISNRVDFAGAAWEPLAFSKAWTLLDGPDGPRRVYAQFRDTAGNMSFAVFDDIIYRRLYMPFVKRR